MQHSTQRSILELDGDRLLRLYSQHATAVRACDQALGFEQLVERGQPCGVLDAAGDQPPTDIWRDRNRLVGEARKAGDHVGHWRGLVADRDPSRRLSTDQRGENYEYGQACGSAKTVRHPTPPC